MRKPVSNGTKHAVAVRGLCKKNLLGPVYPSIIFLSVTMVRKGYADRETPPNRLARTRNHSRRQVPDGYLLAIVKF